MPLVSIIVPVYNAEKYLSECMDCLINQTYKNIEIVCINDGSTDNSLNILKKYAFTDNRVKIYSQENIGEAETRNKGIKLVTGKYVTALDADDICSLNTIETSVKIAEEQNKDIIINFLNVRLDLDKKQEKDFSYTSVWQILYKKELLDNNPDIIYNKNLKMGPDAIFTHKMLGLTDKIAKNPYSFYYYRHHDQQISNIIEKQPEKLLDNIRFWFDDLIDFYTKKNWWKSHNNHFLNFICEQPFTHYIKINWNKKQKQELFNLIHDTINKYNLVENFDYTDKRIKIFKKFLKCKNWQQFEFYRFISYWYFKYINWKKWKMIK